MGRLGMQPSRASERSFACEGDVMIFFFSFENVAMPGRDEKDKSVYLSTFLNGTAFEFFSENFTINGTINAVKDFCKSSRLS